MTALERVISGRYRVEELLGRGGMANVWRGRDLRLDRPVAIKEPAGSWLEDPTAMERFDREARTAARLAHPNIVAVYDVGVHDKGRYLVMELVEGATVADMLSDGPLPVATVIDIAVQTCDGLAAAHSAGIIHRDVKPANLIVTRPGVVKVCDFGIARALPATPDTSLTGPSFAMGSSQYMAPEQATGGPVDARADQYALGCTMYAMLVGTAPFSGDARELLQQHLNEPPVPLREHRADIPVRLEALISQLLAKTPDARPVDALGVRARLLAIDADPTPAVMPVSSPTPAANPTAAQPTATQPRWVAFPLPGSAYPAEPGIATAPPRPRTARRVAWAAAVGFVALAATLTLVAATSGSTSDSRDTLVAPLGTAPTPSMAISAQSHAVIQPSTSTQSTRSAQPAAAVLPSTPAPPVDPVVALRLSIGQQVNTGHLNPDKASDLYKKVDEIARAVNESNTAEAQKKIKELRDKFGTLLNDGQLSAGGYAVLIRDLDVVAAAVA
jgi:eukaryotic-like serine/threonine-protein kinase